MRLLDRPTLLNILSEKANELSSISHEMTLSYHLQALMKALCGHENDSDDFFKFNNEKDFRDFSLILFAQYIDLDGLGSWDSIKLESDEDILKIYNTGINLIDFKGTEFKKFLPFHLYVLLKIYYQMLKDPNFLSERLQTKQVEMQDLLEREIWATTTAYTLYRAYREILDSDATPEDKQSSINALMQTFIEFLGQLTPGDELCFPSGFSQSY